MAREGAPVSQVQAILARLKALGVQPGGVANDSRQVRLGATSFLPIPATSRMGAAIGDAIARGAVAVLWQGGGNFAWNPAWTTQPTCRSTGCGCLPVRWPIWSVASRGARALADRRHRDQQRLHGQPVHRPRPRPQVRGHRHARRRLPGALEDTGFTTPEATTLMRLLARLRSAGAEAYASKPVRSASRRGA